MTTSFIIINKYIVFFVFRCSGQPDMVHHASYRRQHVAIEHGGDRYSTHGLPSANYSSISALIYWLQALLLSINIIVFFVFRCSGQPDMMHHAPYLRQCVAIEYCGDRGSTHDLPGTFQCATTSVSCRFQPKSNHHLFRGISRFS